MIVWSVPYQDLWLDDWTCMIQAITLSIYFTAGTYIRRHGWGRYKNIIPYLPVIVIILNKTISVIIITWWLLSEHLMISSALTPYCQHTSDDTIPTWYRGRGDVCIATLQAGEWADCLRTAANITLALSKNGLTSAICRWNASSVVD